MKSLLILVLVVLSLILFQFLFGQSVLVPLSVAFSLSSVSIGIWLALQEYRLKLASQKIESDVKLMTLFTKLMNTAHSRSGYVVSEKVIEKLFDKDFFSFGSDQNLGELNRKIADAAVINLPVGSAEQDAAIAAIAKLGVRHEVLKDVAIQALKSISSFKPDMADKYLKQFNSSD